MTVNSPLQVWFQALEYGVPDVVVHPPQGGNHFPISDFTTAAELYASGGAYLDILAEWPLVLHNEHGLCSYLQQLSPIAPQIGGRVGTTNGHSELGISKMLT